MVYKFSELKDMVKLARDIQTKVYWGSRFYLTHTDTPYISYVEFWDVTEQAIDQGAIGVTISEDDVIFLYEKKGI